MEIQKTINLIIGEILGSKLQECSFTVDKRLVEDFGAESMQLLEIALSIAAEFDIDVPKEEVMNLKTLGDVYSFVSKKVVA